MKVIEHEHKVGREKVGQILSKKFNRHALVIEHVRTVGLEKVRQIFHKKIY